MFPLIWVNRRNYFPTVNNKSWRSPDQTDPWTSEEKLFQIYFTFRARNAEQMLQKYENISKSNLFSPGIQADFLLPLIWFSCNSSHFSDTCVLHQVKYKLPGGRIKYKLRSINASISCCFSSCGKTMSLQLEICHI